jgi:type IV pilus assembly protein PilM
VKKDELSSTEKLLEQIRGNRSAGETTLGSPAPAVASPGWRERLHAVLNFGKTTFIGVDIGYHDVRLVRTVPSGPNRHRIVDYRHVPFEPGMDSQNLLFPQFLRNALSSFVGSAETVNMWSTISSARLDVRLLRIPKLQRRQIPNAVIWAYKKKNPFNDKQRLFDFEVIGETPDADPPQMDVLAYTIPREDIEGVKTAFIRAGFPLDGVSTYPFLLQNLLRTRWKILGQGNLCALYIGRNWSRIDMFTDGNLLLSRGIRAGMSSMLEEIRADPRIAADKPPEAAREMDFRPQPAASERTRELSGARPATVLARLAPSLALPGEDIESAVAAGDIAVDDIFDIIRPALDRLVRQVERTIGHYAINFEPREIDRLCLSGIICENERVRDYIAEQLGIVLVDLNPFEDEPSTKRPAPKQEQIAYIPAVGLASPAEGRTPNFLQTHHDRAQREKRQLFNSAVFGFFLLTMLGFLGYTGWQKHHLMVRYRQMTHLQQELDTFSPLLNPETVLVLAAKTKEANTRIGQYTEKYRGLAVIAELSRMTPDGVAMTRMTIQLPRTPDGDEKTARRILSIGGVVQGERLHLEPALAAYMVRMKTSPLFADPRIVDKSFEMLGGREVLRFTAELEII